MILSQYLTQRQIEVLRAVAEGASNVAISAKLHIEPRTVERHMQMIMDRLGVPKDDLTNRRVTAAKMFWTSVLNNRFCLECGCDKMQPHAPIWICKCESCFNRVREEHAKRLSKSTNGATLHSVPNQQY